MFLGVLDMGRPVSPCGTEAAYKRHLRRSEEPCDPCRVANRDTQRAKRDRRERVPVSGVSVGADGSDDLALIVDTLRVAFLSVAEGAPEKVAPLAREFRAAVVAQSGPVDVPKELSLADQLAEARAARAARASG